MITKREFYNKVIKMTDEAREAARSKADYIDLFTEQKKSGKYSAAHVKTTIDPRIKELEKEINSIVGNVRVKVGEIVDGYVAELEALDAVRGDALTEDAKLFSVGVTLAKGEIEAIIDRNSDNVTMHKLALRYAKEHDIKLEPRYAFPGHSADIENVKAVTEIATSVVRNHKSDFTREMLMGDNSAFARAFKGA